MKSGPSKFDVTVIIPLHNDSETVAHAIQSATQQTEILAEVIVVDDHSIDGSKTTAQRFGDRITVYTNPGKGAPVARNFGITKSHAPFIKFLDSDDRLHPECLRQQLDQIEREPKDTIVFGSAEWVDNLGQTVDFYPNPPLHDGDILQLKRLIGRGPLTSCPLHRKTLLEAVGGFDEKCPRGQEHDLHVRLAIHGARFVYREAFCYWYYQANKPMRISSRQYERSVIEGQIGTYQRQLALAEHAIGVALPEDIRMAFSRLFWRHGRLCLRAGFENLGQSCFEFSSELAGKRNRGAVGSRIYKVMNGFLGPFRTEKILNNFKGRI